MPGVRRAGGTACSPPALARPLPASPTLCPGSGGGDWPGRVLLRGHRRLAYHRGLKTGPRDRHRLSGALRVPPEASAQSSGLTVQINGRKGSARGSVSLNGLAVTAQAAGMNTFSPRRHLRLHRPLVPGPLPPLLPASEVGGPEGAPHARVSGPASEKACVHKQSTLRRWLPLFKVPVVPTSPAEGVSRLMWEMPARGQALAACRPVSPPEVLALQVRLSSPCRVAARSLLPAAGLQGPRGG